MSVLLTVPHAVCLQEIKVRHCDRVAEKAARILYEMIPSSQLFIGNILRERMDLNRNVSLNTFFRRRIRWYLENTQPLLLLDIHSFPPGEFEGADVAILDEQPASGYGQDLFGYLDENLAGYSIGYFEGSKVNSIIRESNYYGVPALLIEFNESLTDDEMINISQVISSWVKEYIDATQEG